MVELDPSTEASNNDANAVTIQSWKRAWLPDELRNNASQWTLAADAGLLNYMQEFSNRITARTKELEENVNNLVFEARGVDVRLHNTFNQFLMLSNSQFIENRVYDDDAPVDAKETPAEAPATDALSEEVLVPKYTQAIALGLVALEIASSAQDRVNGVTPAPAPAASGDGAAAPTTEPPKKEKLDQYLRQPLPFIIGTKEFVEDEYCGLYYEDSEEEEEEEEVVVEEEEVDSDRDLIPSHASPVKSETNEDNDGPKLDPVPRMERGFASNYGGESDDDGELFPDDESKPKAVAPKDLSKSIGDIFGNDIASEDDSDVEAKPKKKKQEVVENDDGADADVSSSDLRSQLNKTLGQQLGGQKEPDSLIKKRDKRRADSIGSETKSRSNSVTSQPEALKKPAQKPPPSIFGGDSSSDSSAVFSDFEESSSKQAPGGALFGGPVEGKSPAKGLGDLFSDQGGDLFASVPTAKSKAPAFDLFADDDDGGDLFAPSKPKEQKKVEEDVKVEEKKPEKKKPAGAVPMFGADLFGDGGGADLFGGGDDKPKAAAKTTTAAKKPTFDADLFGSDDTDLFASKPAKAETAAPVAAAAAPKKADPKPVSSALFGGDEDDTDLFATKPKPASKPEAAPVKTEPKTESKPKTSSNLFGNDDDSEDLFAPNASKTTKPTDDEDLFAEKPKPVKKEPVVKPPAEDIFASRPKSTKLDSSSDSLFGEPAAAPKKTSAFDEPAQKPKEAPKPVATEAANSKGSSLFFDDDEDLFAPKPKASAPASTQAPKPRDDLFGGDSSLFDEPKTEIKKSAEVEKPKVSVSMFDEPKEEAKPAAKKPTLSAFDDPLSGVPEKKTDLKKSSNSIFGDSDDSDLFSSKPKASAPGTAATPSKPKSASSSDMDDPFGLSKASPQMTTKPAPSEPAADPLSSKTSESQETRNRAKSKIAMLQGALALDPSRMLGGGGPPRKRAASNADEEKPKEAEENDSPQKSSKSEEGPLVDVRKGRATGPKRRAPARGGRGARPAAKAATTTTTAADSASEDDEDLPPAKPKSTPLASSTSLFDEPPKPTKAASIFDDEPKKPAPPKPEPKAEEKKATASSIFDDVPEPVKKEVKPKAEKKPATSMFDDESIPTPAPKAEKPKDKAPVSASSIFDDIPVPEPAPKPAAAKPAKAKKAATGSIFDDDDVPASQPRKNTAKKEQKPAEAEKPKKSATSGSIFDDPAPATASTKATATVSDIFGDSKPKAPEPVTVDIFASSQPAAKPAEKSLDIFDSPKPAAQTMSSFSSKPVEPTPASAPAPSTPSSFSIFDDPLAGKPKPEQKEKKPVTLSIFDDPLSGGGPPAPAKPKITTSLFD